MKKSFIRGVLFFLFILLSVCIITGCPGPETPDGGSQTDDGRDPGEIDPPHNPSGGNTDPANPSNPGTDPSNPSNPSDDDTPATTKVAAAFWGSWKRMDTGDTIQINDEGVVDSWRYIYDFSKFEFESDNVLVYKDGKLNPRFFREGGYARNFTVKVAGLEDASRAADTTFKKVNKAKANVEVKRKNKTNVSDTQIIPTDSTGSAEFTDAVADEIQEISLTSGTKEVKLELTPHFDGEDMGVIPVIEDDKCSFKVSYDVNYDTSYYGQRLSSGYMYANTDYTISLKISNIGNEEVERGYYQISCADPNLSIQTTNGSGTTDATTQQVTLGTVEAYGSYAATKTVYLKVSYSNITDVYVDVPVAISIKDYATKREWNDYITLRFYRRPVFITVNAYNPLNQGTLHGFVIAPDGRSQFFNVYSGQEENIAVPWQKDEQGKYTLVFSGADANSEMFYAFKVKEEVDNSRIFNWQSYLSSASIDDQMAIMYSFDEDGENNDTEATAIDTGNGFTLVKSYIKKQDIDYFTLNINANTLTPTVTVTQLTDISDITVSSTDNGNTLTLTAEQGYDSYQWELNDKVIQTSDSNVLVLNKADLIEGVYDLYLLASKTDSNYTTEKRSSTCQFEVTRE